MLKGKEGGYELQEGKFLNQYIGNEFISVM